jgi:hypothetical protein
MTLHGTIQNGVVLFDSRPDLPDGTPVTVVVERAGPAKSVSCVDRLTDDELQTRRAILDQITAIPSENPGDTFSGADHDRVLYGEP